MLLAVEGCDRGLGFFVAAHLDETEALAAARVAIINDLSRHHLTVLTKELLQLGTIDLIAQVPDIQLLTHDLLTG
jgi:hypothetical protein